MSALLALPLLLVVFVVSTDQPTAANGQVDPAKIPPLARELLPVIQTETARCPELPPVWVVAQVMAESSWIPTAYSDDTNGGAAGLYQLNQANWTAQGGAPWGVPAGVRPPPDADVFDAATHLPIGIAFACANLRNATQHLEATGKPTDPLDAMLVCHIAGCGRVTGSPTGIPTAGQAGCGPTCAQLVADYLTSVHGFVETFAAPGQAADPAQLQALLDNPRLDLTPAARTDLELAQTRPGWIDGRIVGLLAQLTQTHTISISVLRTGHDTFVDGTDRVSNHTVGRGVDISAIDGEPVSPASARARAVATQLLELDADNPLRPTELGSPFADLPAPAFSDAAHQGHLHVGFDAAAPADAPAQPPAQEQGAADAR